MSKEIKYGNEHVNESCSNLRVIRVLYFIVGIAVGVLIMTFK